MPDTLYKNFKSKGLLLSEPTTVIFPPIFPFKPTLLQKLSSLIIKVPKQQHQPTKPIILPIINCYFVVGRANTLICYRLQIEKGSGKMEVEAMSIANLKEPILGLQTCDFKFVQEKGEIPILVCMKNQLSFSFVDLKNGKLVEENCLNYQDCHSARMISDKEVLLLTNNFQIHHLVLESGKLKLKATCPAQLAIGSAEVFQHAIILGSIDEDKLSTIVVFYYLREGDDQSTQILKAKEFQRDTHGGITGVREQYVVSKTKNSNCFAGKQAISEINGFYCIQTKFQIIIFMKQFGKYLIVDTIMEKIRGNKLKLHQSGIVSSQSKESIELNLAELKYPKCKSRLLDNIKVAPLYQDTPMQIWPFIDEKIWSMAVVFIQDTCLHCFQVLRIQPMEKVLDIIAKTEKEEISVIQEIAENLGINRKEFYLTLWLKSPKNLGEIEQFLLPCRNIQSIKKELLLTLRRRKIPVCELVKILESMARIIQEQLRGNISHQMLKEYVKNDFLLRKIKLKETAKEMDHNDMDKCYNASLIDIFVEIVRNELYPEEKKVDPLNSNADEPEKEKINLIYVFQGFKIVILQNYKEFLIAFLSHFSPSQIVNVINHFSYLLPFNPFEIDLEIHEPDYMTEVELNQALKRREHSQSLWFRDITSVEFAREMSKERLESELYNYEQTSKINQAINTLVTLGQKLHKHGFISCTMKQYKEKLHQIRGIKLFLKVCEFANGLNLQDPYGISPQLVQIFAKKNKLTGQRYLKVRLYSAMHRFMLRNNFGEGRILTAEEIMSLRNEDLIALFFLENRQRKEYIFEEFRSIYIDLYGNPQQFNEVIEDFIKSENCSRIELQILINDVKEKSKEFQVENQELIELIMDGFCRKLEIREDHDTEHFWELMGEIELTEKLALKMNKLKKIKFCCWIFYVFYMEKHTYFEMFTLEENKKVYEELLQNFFEKRLRETVLVIEEEEINLQYCRNMLTVLLYLQETIFYQTSPIEILLIYGEVIIQYKEFEVIKEIIFEEHIPQKLQCLNDDYVQRLISRALNSIYNYEELEFNQETKEQIRSILDINRNPSNEVRVKEMAKLELVQIFESLSDLIITTSTIKDICQAWEEEFDKQDIMRLLFTKHSKNLSFSTLKKLYILLDTTVSGHYDEGAIYHQLFGEVSLIFALKLIKDERYPQIIEVLAFLFLSFNIKLSQIIEFPDRLYENYRNTFPLVSETFLRCVSEIYPDRPEGKEAIEYFTQFFYDDQLLQSIFVSNLISAKFSPTNPRQDQIEVPKQFLYKGHPAFIKLDCLWSIAEKEEEKKPKTVQQVYYVYYFLIMGFRTGGLSVENIRYISYNLDNLADSLLELDAYVNGHLEELFALLVPNIMKKFIRGLQSLSLSRINNNNRQDHQTDLQSIKGILKETKDENGELLKCITKVENYFQKCKSMKITERQAFYKKNIEPLKQASSEKRISQSIVEIVSNVNVTMTLEKVEEEIKERTQRSLGLLQITEKQLLEQIYAELHAQINCPKKGDSQGINHFNILPPSAHKRKSVGNLQQIVNLIRSKEYHKAKKYALADICDAAHQIFEGADFELSQMLSAIQELNIGDQKKVAFGRLCEIHLNDHSLTAADLKAIFDFDFFTTREIYEEEEDLIDCSFAQISDRIQDRLVGKSLAEIEDWAVFFAKVFDRIAIISKVYIQGLKAVGRQEFSQRSVEESQQIIEYLDNQAAQLLQKEEDRIISSVHPSMMKTISGLISLCTRRK